MTYEAPQVPLNEAIYPRTPENYPQAGLFNVDAMPDDYIAMLGRSLDREQVRMGEESGSSTREEDVAVSELMAHLGADIAQMAMTNPERGRSLIARLAQSENVHHRNMAGFAAVALGFRGDYEFARGILFDTYERDHSGPGGFNSLSNEHIDELTELLNQMRPDLAADLQRRFADHHRRVFGIEPDAPI